MLLLRFRWYAMGDGSRTLGGDESFLDELHKNRRTDGAGGAGGADEGEEPVEKERPRGCFIEALEVDYARLRLPLLFASLPRRLPESLLRPAGLLRQQRRRGQVSRVCEK